MTDAPVETRGPEEEPAAVEKPAPVEKPPHADATRIRHLGVPALLDALDPHRPELAGLRQARQERGRDAATAALLTHFSSACRPLPLPSIRAQVEVLGDEQRQGVLADAEAARREQPSFTDRALGRSRLYGYHYLGWTRPLLESYALTGEGHWLTSWGGLFDCWYASREEVRGDWPGLDVVWYTLGVASRTRLFADALDLAGDKLAGDGLPDATRLRLLGSVLGGARWLADEHDAFRYGNWQLVGACTLLTLAGLFPEFAEASGWAAIGRERIEEHLALDVYDDGGHHERAPDYHRLSLTTLFDAALHAEAYLGWDLVRHPQLKLMYDWVVDLATPEGWLPPFQDSGAIAAGPLLVRGHYLFGEPAYKAVASQAMAAEEIRQVLAPLPPRDGCEPYAAWQATEAAHPDECLRQFGGSGYVVSREGWTPGSLYAVLNCGPAIPHELESHSHRACLDFVLWGHGAPLAWEAGGPQSYDDPAYHSWFQATHAHNTVVPDRAELSADRDATVETAAQLADLDVVVAFHDGWGRRHRRTLVFVRPGPQVEGYWFVHDVLSGAGSWRWLLHGLSAWTERSAGTFVSAKGPGLVAVVPAIGSATYETSEGMTSVPTPDGPHWQALHGLAVHPAGSELAAVLVPFRDRVPADVHVDTSADAARVRVGDTTDELRPGSWVRHTGAEPVAAATWGGVAVGTERTLLAAAPRTRTLHVRWTADRVTADADATHRTPVTLAVPDAWDGGAVRVNGIAVPHVRDRGTVTVDLPQAGRWTIEISRRA
ncbi:heparinase II/III family protein [Actinopolymorpha sp. B17G11]|uniref:heparinase II/III domain-containing protein n=1 Tax=Actinopolymorpha sp. B17G11 TaxID=3160861 RepID=UPI0032E3E18F